MTRAAEQSRAAKQSIAIFLIAAALSPLVWRLRPDGGRARQQQHDTELLRAVSLNRLADAKRLLDEGADPNTQTRPLSASDKARLYYVRAMHTRRPPA